MVNVLKMKTLKRQQPNFEDDNIKQQASSNKVWKQKKKKLIKNLKKKS
jgi:hypothetical protein